MKVEAVFFPGSPSLTVRRTVSACSGHTASLEEEELCFRVQELCESRGGRLGLPVPNSTCGLCGRKTMLNWFPLWVTAEAETKHPPPTLPFICLILPSRCIFTPMLVL